MTDTPDIIESTPRVIPSGSGRIVAPPDPSMPFPRIDFKVGVHDDLGFSLIEFEVPANFAPPPVLHRHTRENAVIYVLDGELEYTFADGSTEVATAGSVVHLPAGAWFRWHNPHPTKARMLCIFCPAGFEEYFSDVATGLAAADFDPRALGSLIPPLREKYGDQDQS